MEPELPPVELRPLSFLPVPVSFAGMPSHCYWKMENRRIEFADIDAQTTDIAKLILTEFTVVYGNDWFIIPDDVEIGSVCEVPGMLVTDPFGEKVLVCTVDRGIDDEWQPWTMFTLSTNRSDGRADTRLFVPPSLPKLMESALPEKVIFLRDEMANMAWAIERTIWPCAWNAGTSHGHSYTLPRPCTAGATVR
jgi:hypothetical protein